MDAWQTLVENSTLLQGDAWEHLNAQGGGGSETIIHADGMEVDVDMLDVLVYVETETEVDVTVDLSALEIEIETERTVEI